MHFVHARLPRLCVLYYVIKYFIAYLQTRSPRIRFLQTQSSDSILHRHRSSFYATLSRRIVVVQSSFCRKYPAYVRQHDYDYNLHTYKYIRYFAMRAHCERPYWIGVATATHNNRRLQPHGYICIVYVYMMLNCIPCLKQLLQTYYAKRIQCWVYMVHDVRQSAGPPANMPSAASASGNACRHRRCRRPQRRCCRCLFGHDVYIVIIVMKANSGFANVVSPSQPKT